MKLTLKNVREASLALLPPIFAECTGTEHRYSLSAPWIHEDWVVATDGVILARTRLDCLTLQGEALLAILLFDVGRGRLIKDPMFAFKDVEWESEGFELGNLPGAVPCGNCGGKRIMDEDDNDFDTRLCMGCDATGWVIDPMQKVPVNGLNIALGRAWTLKKHEARLFVPVGKDRTTKPLKWITEDAEGLIMTMIGGE